MNSKGQVETSRNSYRTSRAAQVELIETSAISFSRAVVKIATPIKKNLRKYAGGSEVK